MRGFLSKLTFWKPHPVTRKLNADKDLREMTGPEALDYLRAQGIVVTTELTRTGPNHKVKHTK